MATKSVDGLAALCLIANGFKAEGFAEERLRDGRISGVQSFFHDGKFVVLVYAGTVNHFTRGASRLCEDDARAQALQSFWCWELEEAAKKPGDYVELGAACF